METLGHIPEAGEQVDIGIHKITVLEAEPTRINRLLIERLPPESRADTNGGNPPPKHRKNKE